MMSKITRNNFFFLLCLLFLFSIKSSANVDEPIIVAGKAKITGSLIKPNAANGNIDVHITVPHPISGEYVKYKTQTNQDGVFALDVDIETNTALIYLNTSINPENVLYVKVTNGGVANIDITYNSDDEIKSIGIAPNMPQADIARSFELMMKMLTYKSGRTPESLYDKTPGYFLQYAKNILSERLAVVNDDISISKEFKDILVKDFSMTLYNNHVFDYEEEMLMNFSNVTRGEEVKPILKKIDRTYFGFLKEFKLNNPLYLQCPTFLEFQKAILQNEVLALPKIEESDIATWLKNMKAILADLVGFDNGLYYDILAANAYGRQLNEELRPLSDKHKKNIEKYWKNGEIAKILLKKNQEIVALEKLKSPLVVNDVTSVANDKIVETILAKHQNKVVVIDFWATWCVPCLNAMQEFRATKDQFKGKEVVFVYLTNGSSPKKLWEEKIKGIGSEHYYLNGPQWKYLMNHYDFEYIPSYLIYDKGAKLINKFSAFPSSEKVKEMINSLL